MCLKKCVDRQTKSKKDHYSSIEENMEGYIYHSYLGAK